MISNLPLPQAATKLLRLPYLLLAAWALTMISLPIFYWTVGMSAVLTGLTYSVIIQATAVFVLLGRWWGWRQSGKTVAIVALITLAVETIGSRTGVPFGRYHYTDLIQPQIADVPVIIPLAWFMMLPPAWAVASAFHARRWTFVAISAAAFTAWDLFLDPQMVAWGLWQWDQPGGYFGIPWVNYLGWFVTAALITAVLRPQRSPLPLRPLLIIYTVTWFLETVGLAFFWELAGPAMVGGLIMGGLTLMGWRSAVSRQPVPATPQPTDVHSAIFGERVTD